MKKCPFCAENIANNATECKFCWEKLKIEKENTVLEHLTLIIKNFLYKKQMLKSILRYTISIIFIIAGRITYSNKYYSLETYGIILLISWAIWFYITTLID